MRRLHLLVSLVGAAIVLFHMLTQRRAPIAVAPSDGSATSRKTSAPNAIDPKCAELERRFKDAVGAARREHAERKWANKRPDCPRERRSWRQQGLSFQVVGTPCQPWWRQDAIAIVAALASKDDVAVEWGSGSSSFWLAERVGRLHAVEHNEAWGEHMRRDLNRLFGNARVHVADTKEERRQTCSRDGCEKAEWDALDELRRAAYANVTLSRGDGSVDTVADLVVDDGRMRFEVMKRALRLLKPEGGVLVLDNSNRYTRDFRPDFNLPDLVPRHWLRYTSPKTWPDDGSLSPEDRRTANLWIQRDFVVTTVWMSRPAHCAPREALTLLPGAAGAAHAAALPIHAAVSDRPLFPRAALDGRRARGGPRRSPPRNPRVFKAVRAAGGTL